LCDRDMLYDFLTGAGSRIENGGYATLGFA
jgi:hypothetical protein